MQKIYDPRTKCFMCAAEDRNADRIDIFLQRRRRDHLGRLPETGVDHFHSGIPKRASDNLGAAVMSVEPRLCNKDPDLSLTHIARSILANKAYKQTVAPNVGLQLGP